MPDKNKTAAAEWKRKRRAKESKCQGCGIQPASEYRRVNPASPGLKLCGYCIIALERVAGLLVETPAAGRYCAKGIEPKWHLIFGDLRPMPAYGLCRCCGHPVNPNPAAAIAALPPAAPDMRPGGIRGRYAAPAPVTAGMLRRAMESAIASGLTGAAIDAVLDDVRARHAAPYLSSKFNTTILARVFLSAAADKG